MKKLLSILTISTLAMSVPAPLLANTVRAKRDVITSNSNNDYPPLKQINGVNDNINSIIINKNNNIYFGTTYGLYVLKHGETTASKINNIDNIVSVSVDSKDNIYVATQTAYGAIKLFLITNEDINLILKWEENDKFWSLTVDSKDNIYVGTDKGIFVLKQGATTATPIDGITGQVPTIAIDKDNNIYFKTKDGIFVLKQGSITPTKINGINNVVNAITFDSSNNVYFGTDKGIYFTTTVLDWVKQQSQFNLVDSTKTQTWTRPDLLSVDGEVNIEIANPNIDKVVFDNVQQPQTNKQWKINVKPETSEKDHNLQVMFTLNGKQYTSEIIVSMQAKIDPTPTPVQQNLSDLIKNTDLGNILDNNDDTIFAAVNQKNGNIIDDFSKIKITKKR